MQHIRNIETAQSRRDARWNAARTADDCNLYMAIEAQSQGRLGHAFLENNRWRGPGWVRGATAAIEERYRYAREIMGCADIDQFYA